MKKYEIKFLSTAYRDIAEVISDTSEVADSWAAKFVDELERHVDNLETMPKMYPIYEDMPEFRKMNVIGFLAFYTVDDKAGIVEVHRIINSRMDVKSRF